ncbi:hypothetical protein EOE67_13645 [Rheinheimera riviphila]|uniref:Uncharacterized protein n=1 Tax=Rheinheimera riviphila TaxID=1834037 RepID=A0A437QLM3_9GAMM|nr:TorF family putative porin [Rheinheimera riviphila]RVU35416.1 hypothetical protein EOE67_13645 [Rheinheimera riviphila]
MSTLLSKNAFSAVKSTVLLATVMLITATPLQADEFKSAASVTLISDYLYRGISQTNEGPALQASLTLQHQSGAYLNAWGSNIKFGDGSMELDLSAGYLWQLNPDWKLDLGLMQYRYPKGDNASTEFNFVEAYGKLSYQQLTVGLAITDDYFAAGVGKFVYWSADWNQQLSNQLLLQWHLGYNQFANTLEYKNFMAASDESDQGYVDWSLKLQSSQFGFDWGLAYAGTSVDTAACATLCDNRWLVSVSKSF